MKPITKRIKEAEEAKRERVMRLKSYRLEAEVCEAVRREAARLKTTEGAIVRAALKMALGITEQ